MPGPVGKHPSARARRNRQNSGYRSLSPVPAVEAPAWPLAPDATMDATREQLRDSIASTQQALTDEEDRRKRYRLNKKLEQAQIALAILEVQIAQAADNEAAMWAELWRSAQAAIWAENTATVRELGLYVRWMIRAEQGDTKAASEARLLSDRLGINPAALLRLRAEIENVDAIEDRGRRRRERAVPKPADDAPGDDPRGGLFAVK